MTITVFTSNQPRHIALIERLATVADRVFAIQECNTIAPGEVADFFAKSRIMQDYFSRVIRAEQKVFGAPRFLPPNARSLAIRMGDLNRLPLEAFHDALSADVIIVFGASFIRAPLVDRLVERGAVNIHMGVSPWYRGSSTNFWAMYDRRPQLVGATIHRLSRGLDSGDMLFHAFPTPQPVDPFEYGMLAVRAAQDGLTSYLATNALRGQAATPQDKSLELRYTRNADFTDTVAAEYLQRLPTPSEMHGALFPADRSSFLRAFIGSATT